MFSFTDENAEFVARVCWPDDRLHLPQYGPEGGLAEVCVRSNTQLRVRILIKVFCRPVRGMGAVVAGAGPAHALYFATYEYSKEVSQKLFPQHQSLTISTYTLYQ